MSTETLRHESGGRTWLEVGREPYVRKSDGKTIELIRWQGRCVVCGASFTVSTPVAYETSKAFRVKHCEAHRLTKEQSQRLGTEAAARARTAAAAARRRGK